MTIQWLLKDLDYVTKVKNYEDGVPVMIECFATWCPACKGAIPSLVKLHEKFQKVFIVSISTEDKQKVEGMKGKMPMMQKYNLAVD